MMGRTGKKVGFLLAILVLAILLQLSPVEVNGASTELEQRLRGALVLYVNSPQAYVNNSLIRIEENNTDLYPVEMQDGVLVPLRFTAESLGARVAWEGPTSSVTVTTSDKLLKFKPGSKILTINGRETELETPHQMINGRVFVPVELLSEALGKKVFSQQSGLIMIGDREDLSSLGQSLLEELKSKFQALPTVGSYQNLKELLEQTWSGRAGNNNYTLYSAKKEMALMDGAPVRAAADAGAAAPAPEAKGDFSATNVQVEGVDEADLVKTDGEYIYQVNRERVVIVKAYPADKLEVASILDFTDREFSPRELYLDAKHLVVIGTTLNRLPVKMPEPFPQDKRIRPPYYASPLVKVIIYDIQDKANPKQVREVELEGNYLSSRKIGQALYLATNKYFDYYLLQQEQENLTPVYRDTALKDEYVNINYSEIYYFPGYVHPNYLLVAGLNLDRNEEPVQVSTYLGAGENIYASLENLYVAVTEFGNLSSRQDKGPEGKLLPIDDRQTAVYKFALREGEVSYQGKGEVPGTILNQFSMDEDQNYLRVATTTGDIWHNDEFASKNNVYILDNDLQLVGRLEDIAPGEKIYSVRFMGNRGYLVTFKTVDPLFVIDLQEPKHPQILGALKIPGYSDYLHPYDENHLIGFGKEALEVMQKDQNGNEVGRMAYYQGMKMAVFDVSDVRNPVQKFAETIGDRGTDSELLRNHKALLFDREKNLLAFPVTVMEITNNSTAGDKVTRYGEFTFQGAYVYSLDLSNGFKLKGQISHLTSDDYAKAGNHWYDSEKNVERVLYIQDTLYTLSRGVIKAHKLADLQEIKSLAVPQ